MIIPGSIPVGRIAGIPIFVHITLPIVAVVLAVTNKEMVLIPLIAVLSVCILLHELGHALVAIDKGCQIPQILLTPIGGVAQISSPTPLNPQNEVQVAIAGPLVSLALAIAVSAVGYLVWWMEVPIIPIYVIGIGVANLIFFLFNLIPAFPMDGGRLLRAWLTEKKGRLEATRIARNLGRIFAVLFFIVGFVIDDKKLMLIAFFIYFAAGFEYRLIQKHTLMQAARGDEPQEGDGLIVGPAPYEKAEDSPDDLRLHPLRETIRAARILARDFARLHKL